MDYRELAAFQRPGVVICVGPTEVRERRISPLPWHEYDALPGPSSWLAIRLGFEPSLFAVKFAAAAGVLKGHAATDDEWRWLHGPASLNDARAWLAALGDDQPRTPERPSGTQPLPAS